MAFLNAGAFAAVGGEDDGVAGVGVAPAQRVLGEHDPSDLAIGEQPQAVGDRLIPHEFAQMLRRFPWGTTTAAAAGHPGTTPSSCGNDAPELVVATATTGDAGQVGEAGKGHADAGAAEWRPAVAAR